MRVIRNRVSFRKERLYAFIGTTGLKNIGNSILSNIKKDTNTFNNFMLNPGKSINNGIASVIRHPARSITEAGSFGVKKVIDNSLPNLAGGAIGVTDFIPRTGISSKIGNKIQRYLDKGNKGAAVERAFLANKYLKSPTASNLEYGVNRVAEKASQFGSIFSL